MVYGQRVFSLIKCNRKMFEIHQQFKFISGPLRMHMFAQCILDTTPHCHPFGFQANYYKYP